METEDTNSEWHECDDGSTPEAKRGRMAGPPPGLSMQPELPQSVHKVYMHAAVARQEFPQHDYVGRAKAMVWLAVTRDRFVNSHDGPWERPWVVITSGSTFPWHRYLLSSPKLQEILQHGVLKAWAVEDQHDNTRWGFVFQVRSGPSRFWSVRPGRKREVEAGIADGFVSGFAKEDDD